LGLPSTSVSHIAARQSCPQTSKWGLNCYNENSFLDPLENHRTQWTEVLKAFNPKAGALHTAAKVD